MLVYQSLHHRVPETPLLQLDQQAFEKAAPAHPGGVKRLDHPEHRPGLLQRTPAGLAGLLQVDLQVAVLIDIADQKLPNPDLARIGQGEVQLQGQVLAEAGNLGHISIPTVAFRLPLISRRLLRIAVV